MSASSDVTAGTTNTAAQYNNLRADVVNTSTGHIHDGTAAKTMLGTAVPLIDAAAGAAGTTGTSLLLARQDHVHPGVALHASHTYATGTMASDLTAGTAGTWRDGPSISLTAGTWLIVAHANVMNNSASGYCQVRLWNGSTVVAAAATGLAAASSVSNVGLTGIVIPTGSETWKLSFTGYAAGTVTMYAKAPNDGTTGLGASTVSAIRLGHVAG